MHILGEINNLRAAQAFSDYLRSRGIENKLNPLEGKVQILILQVEYVSAAAEELQAFMNDPNDPKYLAASWQVNSDDNVKLSGNTLGSIIPQSRFKQTGPVTLGIMILCIVIYSFTNLFQTEIIYEWLAFPATINELSALSEPWRMLTPVFMHFGLMHIAFNLLWWFELGRIIETTESGWQLLMLLVIIGLFSNLWQYTMTGPNFGGLSGVVYGLMGYLWLYGKTNPTAGYQLRPQIVIMMIAWLVFCFIVLENIVANWAHLGGLVIGGLTGFGFGLLHRYSNKPAP
ncbi:MAG: rhomboid family intramembrane serine protease GlpG [Pseudomonadales bacterium]|nr:rhomboid family intramembrane serine protease GlpG [Pseudomonadales bacterium]